MARSQQKYLILLVIGLWYALLGVMFLIVRPELAYSYGHWLGGFAGNLPQLTSTLSLPVLGPAFSTPSQDYSAAFWLTWGFLFLPPALALHRLRRVGNDIDFTNGLLWAAIYLLLALLLGTMVTFGLWLPFSAA
jgi:hypothetical protein